MHVVNTYAWGCTLDLSRILKLGGKTHFQSETADTAKCQCGTVATGQKLQTEHGKLLKKKIFQMQERMETEPVQPGWGTFFQLTHEDVTFVLAKVNLRYRESHLHHPKQQKQKVAQDDEAQIDRITSLQYNNTCRVGRWMTLLDFVKVGGDVERGP